MFRHLNLNPLHKNVGDCTVRAISLLMDEPWDKIYTDLSVLGFEMKDLLDSNAVWGQYLNRNGYRRHIIPDTCPDCFTIKDFCRDNPHGRFLLATGTHVVTVIDGDYYDTWDSGDKIPIYFWKKK